MKILVGSVCRQHPDVLRAHLETLRSQVGKFTTEFAFVDDNTDMDSKLMLPGHVMPSDPKPEDARYAVGETTHEWAVPTFRWLGKQKQRLIKFAKDGGFDGIFLVDSDLLCGPDTLSSLIASGKDVVSAVFWTSWMPNQPPLPQVWLAHPYGLEGRGLEQHEFLGKLAKRELVRVGGLGACTLIRSNVFDKVAYWPLVEGLPNEGMWQGEDRHFCITAERNHVELWADAWPDVWHCYRPSDRVRIDELMFGGVDGWEALNAGPPGIGDLISAQIRPLEEPKIQGYVEHVRGRLGQLRLLPDVENALMNMRVGETRIVKANFPHHYDIASYRGQSRLLQVKLLGAKPYSLPPTLGESVEAA